jgi:hypothetical protein
VIDVAPHTAVNQSEHDSNCTVNLVCSCGFVMKPGNANHTPKAEDCTACYECSATIGTHTPKAENCKQCQNCTTALSVSCVFAPKCAACQAECSHDTPNLGDCAKCDDCGGEIPN